jgi:hypothetical protein
MSLVFKLSKGLLYGITIGLFFGLSIFLIATAVASLGFITLSPTFLAALIFANGVLGGIAMEYGKWLKATKNGGLIFGLTNGFLNGVVFGLFFGLAVFLMTGALYTLGWLTLTPVTMASLTFAASILMFVTYEYSNWLDAQEATVGTQLATTGAGPPKTP